MEILGIQPVIKKFLKATLKFRNRHYLSVTAKRYNWEINSDITFSSFWFSVLLTGIEPVLRLGNGILSPTCLPIPPQQHID